MHVQDEETSPGSVTNQPQLNTSENLSALTQLVLWGRQSPVTTGSTRVSNMRKPHQVVSQSKPDYIHLKDTNQARRNTSENLFSITVSVRMGPCATDTNIYK